MSTEQLLRSPPSTLGRISSLLQEFAQDAAWITFFLRNAVSLFYGVVRKVKLFFPPCPSPRAAVGPWLGRQHCQPLAQLVGDGSAAVGWVFAWWQYCLRQVLGQCCACSPRPGLGLPVHFPPDLGPILAVRRALVNEACSVPSQLLWPGLSKQVCGMWQCMP